MENLQNEIWKNIDGYTGLYMISNKGRVISLSKYSQNKKSPDKLLKIQALKNYPQVNLYKNKKGRSYRIHRLVAEAFIPKSENKTDVNHINGDKTDNRVENLEWCTKKQNSQHAIDTGLLVPPIFRGEENSNSKLKNETVMDLRALYKSGMRVVDIAKKYNLKLPTVEGIVYNKTWKHLL
jgi:hypothetical protein